MEKRIAIVSSGFAIDGIIDRLMLQHPEMDRVSIVEAVESTIRQPMPVPIELKFIEPMKAQTNMHARKSDVQPWKKSWKK